MSDRRRVLMIPESAHALYFRLLRPQLEAQGWEVNEAPLPWIRWPGNCLDVARELVHKPDVCQIHWDTFDSRLAMRAFFATRPPKVWTVHTITQNAPPSMRGLDVTAAYLRRADVAVWHSARTINEVRRRLTEAGLPSTWHAKNVVIPHMSFNGVFPDETPALGSRDALGIPRDAFVVGHFSPSERKGTRRFLEVVRAMPESGIRFLIFGRCEDPMLTSEIQECARQTPSLKTRIDWIPKEELQCWFKSCDVVVEPYLDCVTSSTVQCAMAFRRASIAPPFGNLPDLVIPGQTGWLATSTSEIVEAIKEAASAVQRTHVMGERAYTLADSLGSREKVGRAYAHTYSALVM